MMIHLLLTLLYSLSTAQLNTTSSNPCDSYAICGSFGICNPHHSPICNCLQAFKPINTLEWYSGNWTAGCERKLPLMCQGRNGNSEDGFREIEKIKVPGYGSRMFASETICPGMCLMNCSCTAYAHDNDLGCMFWNTNLLDIQMFPTGAGTVLHYRVDRSELDHRKDFKKIIVVSAVVGVGAFSICMCFFWKWRAKRRGKKREIEVGKTDEFYSLRIEELPLFKLEILVNATEGFSDSNKLGKGGFGIVYKGKLENGREIAVKRLSVASRQGMQEFMNEVMLISKLQHRNLVKLLGCCVENNEKMLIYEYMPNKSLDHFLFGLDHLQLVLGWRKRFNIVEGICRGLLYLHRDSRLKIIHRDLKPSNILLDNDWNPKISDFGLARIFESNQDHLRTLRVVGTYGYMAPEYAIEGKFSEKSDVFSLGVLMLEIVSGRRNTSFYKNESSLNLLGHVWRQWNEDNIGVLIDARMSSTAAYQTEIVRCIHIGLLCVQELPKDRPTISAVLSMLSSEIVELPKAKQPAFVLNSRRGETSTSSSKQSKKSSCSLNDASLTVVDGR